MVCMARAEHWFGGAGELDTFTVLYVGCWLARPSMSAACRVSARTASTPSSATRRRRSVAALQPAIAAAGAAWRRSHRSTAWPGHGPARAANGRVSRKLGSKVRHVLDLAEAGDRKALAVRRIAPAEHLGLPVANHLNASRSGHVSCSTVNRRLQRGAGRPTIEAIKENTLAGILPDQNRLRSGRQGVAVEGNCRTRIGKALLGRRT